MTGNMNLNDFLSKQSAQTECHSMGINESHCTQTEPELKIKHFDRITRNARTFVNLFNKTIT